MTYAIVAALGALGGQIIVTLALAATRAARRRYLADRGLE